MGPMVPLEDGDNALVAITDLQEGEEASCESSPCLGAAAAARASCGAKKGGEGGEQQARPSLRAAAYAGLLAAGLVVACGLSKVVHHHLESKRDSKPISFLSSPAARSTTIRWLAHPSKCLDVAGKGRGAALQIWDCDPNYPFQQGFMVPKPGETGRIRWAQDPHLCLDSPGGHAVQFWTCADSPPANVLWTVSPDGEGRIHWAAHPEQCLDVPDANTNNGWKLQVWTCGTVAGKESNLRFVTSAVDCKWGDWGLWGPCSSSCGDGRRIRTRYVAMPAMNGGEDCGGIDSDEAQVCRNAVACEEPAAAGAELLPAAPAVGRGKPSLARLLPLKNVQPLGSRSAASASVVRWPLLLLCCAAPTLLPR